MSRIEERGYAHPEALVSTDWVVGHFGDPDVRLIESNEDTLLYASGHVPGAVLIPINPVTGFMQRKDELSREVPIIFVCGVGQRSALACEVAAALGFADLYNLEGGTEDWIKSGQPVQK